MYVTTEEASIRQLSRAKMVSDTMACAECVNAPHLSEVSW